MRVVYAIADDVVLTQKVLDVKEGAGESIDSSA